MELTGSAAELSGLSAGPTAGPPKHFRRTLVESLESARIRRGSSALPLVYVNDNTVQLSA